MSDFYIYLAGRMRGLPEHGYPAFIEAEEQLRKRGYTQIINPIHHADGVGTELPYEYYITQSIRDMIKAHAVCVLPLWEQSQGAGLEVHIGVVRGLPIYRLEDLLQVEQYPRRLAIDFDIKPAYTFI